VKKRYTELDALRGIAALIVVFFHYTFELEESPFVFRFGITGVDLFFIISGFVILFSLKNITNYKQFVANRLSRLYPTYWACVIFTFSMMVAYAIYRDYYAGISIKQFLINLTMFQYYFKVHDLDGPYWSLIIEMVFYIIMGTLFHFRQLKHIDVIFLTLSILTALSTHLAFENAWVQRVFYKIPVLQFLPLFHAGTIFYRIIAENKSVAKDYILIALCFIIQVIMYYYAGRSRFFVNIYEYTFMLTIYFALFILFVNGKLEFIVSKPTLFLGKISYALYLTHQKLSLGFILPYLLRELNFNFWVACIIAFACSIGVASAITYAIEIPYSKKMRNQLYSLFKINTDRRSVPNVKVVEKAS